MPRPGPARSAAPGSRAPRAAADTAMRRVPDLGYAGVVQRARGVPGAAAEVERRARAAERVRQLGARAAQTSQHRGVEAGAVAARDAARVIAVGEVVELLEQVARELDVERQARRQLHRLAAPQHGLARDPPGVARACHARSRSATRAVARSRPSAAPADRGAMSRARATSRERRIPAARGDCKRRARGARIRDDCGPGEARRAAQSPRAAGSTWSRIDW